MHESPVPPTPDTNAFSPRSAIGDGDTGYGNAVNVKRTVRRVKRVGTEIEAMRLIDDQFVCKLLDVIHTPDYVHLIMEKGGCDLCVLRTR